MSDPDAAGIVAHCSEVDLVRDTLLHETGDKIEQVYFPISGMISLLSVLDNGTAIETQTIGQEGVVGATLTLKFRRASTRAVVQASGKALRISDTAMRRRMAYSAPCRDVIAVFTNASIAKIQRVAVCNWMHKVEARLARWLLQAHDRLASDELPLTQEFLSQMLGVRRSSLNASAQALQNNGAIEYVRGKIRASSRRQLERSACECYAAI
jgi:CRP-like cAMP-binding protein